MEFYDVTDWVADMQASSRGTRDKGIVYQPHTNKEFFLKFPLLRENRDYWSETWSEIVASEVGMMLGFDVLPYHFAIKGERQGCLSEIMHDVSKGETLVEGEDILSAFDQTYHPNDKSHYDRYTLPFVLDAITYKYGLNQLLQSFLDMLVFDAIIGNSDRHQGNWGVIQSVQSLHDGTEKKYRFFAKSKKKNTFPPCRFAPIYDSGCCLGREFSNQAISNMLSNNGIEKYVQKGMAELRSHYNPHKKMSHFQLLRYIASESTSQKDILLKRIRSVEQRYNEREFQDLIDMIDKPLPHHIREAFGLSTDRRRFIAEVIKRRIQTLITIEL